MTKKKKIISAVAAVAVLALAAAAAIKFATAEPKALVPSEQYDTLRIMNVGGYDVYYAEFRHYFMIDGGKLQAIEKIRHNRTITALAEEYGVALTEEEEQQVQASIDGIKENLGGDEAMTAFLTGKYLTEKLYKDMTLLNALESKLKDTLCKEGGELAEEADKSELIAFAQDNYIRVRHIFAEKTEDGSGEEKIAAAKAALDGGADFETVMSRYSEEDPSNPTGESFITYGTTQEEYEAAAFKLAEGEVSGAVTAENGYFIIQRLAADEEYILANTDSFSERFALEKYLEYYDLKYDLMKVEYDDIYYKLSDKNIK